MAAATTTAADASATTTTSTTSTTSKTSATKTATTTSTSSPEYLLGPLTTTFTAPTQCSQAYWESASDVIYDPTIGQTCTSDSEIYYTQDDDCLPPVTKTTLYGSLTGSDTVTFTSSDYFGYYSPGIACPAGYTTACAGQMGSNAIESAFSNYQSFDFIFPATASETVVGCCPTGYQCANFGSTEQWCQQIVASTTVPVITCANATNKASVSTTVFTLPHMTVLSEAETYTSSSTTITSTYTVSTLSMLATMIQLNFQATDLPVSTASTSSSSMTSTSSTSQAATTNTSSPGSSGSSSHKTTAIAAGVVVPCVALIAAGLAWLWYRRRTKKQNSVAYQAAPPTEPSDMYQSSGAPSTFQYRASSAPTEISAEPARYEIAGSVPQYEMAGTDPSTVAHEMYAGDEMPRYHDNETSK